jgi:hypothetical protein
VRAAKVDANAPELVESLRAMGYSVDVLPGGNGRPDLLVGVPASGANVLLEVKQPGGKLNPLQVKWHREWKGKAHVVWSFQDALMVLQSYGRQG